MGTKTQKLSNVVDQIVEWQSVFTGDGSTGLTAVAGRGYFIDTTSGTVTVTLPVSPKAGDIVQLKDYARTWGTNAISMASTTFDGTSNTPSFSTNGQTVTLVYMDGTRGWSLINEDTTTSLGAQYVTATGGTVTTSGDYKIHTFTGDGCFVVSCAGNANGSNKVSYVVVAGGGSGMSKSARNGTTAERYGMGGGGAGGYREGKAPSFDTYTASPLVAPDGLPVSVQTYPVTVGAGGAAVGVPSTASSGPNGSNSVFSTITSAGGGGGGYGSPCTYSTPGDPGGSGGGGGAGPPSEAGGNGNTPPVSPPQGNNGGLGKSSEDTAAGGGGGAGAVGAAGASQVSPRVSCGGAGGAGVTSEITGSPVARAGGGGGGTGYPGEPGSGTVNQGAGGSGGGGAGGHNPNANGVAGTANTGGGGGGAGGNGSSGTCTGGSGGKGVVIIRYKFQN